MLPPGWAGDVPEQKTAMNNAKNWVRDGTGFPQHANCFR
jgi:hypothetical protein